MPTPSTDLLEMILRECAAAQPAPWYPSSYAQETGIARDGLDDSLDELRLAGLVRLTDWVQGKGQGYTLTAAGEEVLQNQRLLGRLRTGAVPVAKPQAPAERSREEERPPGWERAKLIKDTLTTSRRPVATLSLIATNVLVFLGGMLIAWLNNVPLQTYVNINLQGNAPDAELLHRLGALRWNDLFVWGEWWRLFSCLFVHGGLPHLAMNMYALYVLGVMLERMWGPGRMLLLYLVSGLGGSCAAMMFSPPAGGVVGASGAICGMLGSMLAWTILNRPYLPTSMASAWMRGTMINIVLIAVISMLPNISASAHLGGGVTGLLASVPLNASRYGRGLWRWLGLGGAVLVGVAAFGALQIAFARQPEAEQAQLRYGPAIKFADPLLVIAVNQSTISLARKGAANKKISPEDAELALQRVADARAALAKVAPLFQRAPRYEDPRLNEALSFGREYVQNWSKYLDRFAECLDAQGAWKCGNDATLEDSFSEGEKARDSLLASSLFRAAPKKER